MKIIMLWLCLFSFMNLSADNDYESEVFTNNSFLSGKCFSFESFRRSFFYGADFTKSNIWHCRFNFARFNGDPSRGSTKFDGANLTGSWFMHADCENVSFKNAELKETWLWHGNYRGADFTNANLQDAIMFFCTIGLEGKNKTRVKGANFKDVRGLTNKQKKYLRRTGALNVPADCDEEEEWEEFCAQMDKEFEELSPFYPLNKWTKACGRGVGFSVKWLWAQAISGLGKVAIEAKKFISKPVSS